MLAGGAMVVVMVAVVCLQAAHARDKNRKGRVLRATILRKQTHG